MASMSRADLSRDLNKYGIYRSRLVKPQIRILSLHPGSWDDEIRCDPLEIVSLDSIPFPVYEAISYRWDDPPFEMPKQGMVWIGGRVFTVEATVERLLRRLRLYHPYTPRRLWIDSICINQNDKVELSRQVEMMGDIYKRCKRCLIWLGDRDQIITQVPPPPPSDDEGEQLIEFYNDERDFLLLHAFRAEVESGSDLVDPSWDPHLAVRGPSNVSLASIHLWGALCFLRHMAENDHLTQTPLFHQELSFGREGDAVDVVKIPSDFIRWYEALAELLGRAYWNRTWIIQEIALPPGDCRVYLDRFVFPFSMLSMAAKNWSHHTKGCCHQWVSQLPRSCRNVFRHMPSKLCRLAWQRDTIQCTPPETWSLGALLLSYRDSLATNPRDKVYGLLGLVSSWDEKDSGDHSTGTNNAAMVVALSVDYDLDTAQVYTLATWHVIETQHRPGCAGLNILATEQAKSGHIHGLPSWVPDWSLDAFENRQFWNDLWGSGPYYWARFRASLHYRIKPALIPVGKGPSYALQVANINVDSVVAVATAFEPLDHLSAASIFDTISRDRIFCGLPASSLFLNRTNRDPHITDPGPSLDQRETEFWTTRFGDTLATGERINKSSCPPLTREDIDDIVSWWEWIVRNKDGDLGRVSSLNSLSGPSNVPDGPFPYFGYRIWSALCTSSQFLSMFQTERGRLGMGPSRLRAGDEIHVLVGANIPFALRPSGRDGGICANSGLENHSSCYQMVGACYLYGVMDGEAMVQYKDGNKLEENSSIYLV